MDSNPKIASLASRLVEPNYPSGRSGKHHDNHELDDDAIFAELEAEIENDDNSAIREQGLAILKREMEKMQHMKANEYGKYTEITDEKEVVRITAHEPRVVIHFYHTNFKRCEIMDKHLTKLAPKYFNTRFSRVFVENIPWLVERLSIKMLPCVICFVKGVTKDRLVGFEELGNNDAFTTATLELRLAVSGVIQKPNEGKDLLYKVASSQKDDDDEFDL
ncbi:thioredoxin-like protein [Marasmius fiardii PR-910]|nr:thioredoxin-like protein [Marasmius fiardii PR-910]